MILVTGANGFVGSCLVHALSNEKLVLLDRNPPTGLPCYRHVKAEISSNEDYLDYLVGCKVIVHCAGRVHVMRDTSKEPLLDYREVNSLGTVNLAKQAVEAGVERFIFISSIKVNGESSEPTQPFTAIDSAGFVDYYGQSKYEAEIELKKLAHETGLEVVIIRPTLVYGAKVEGNFASMLNLVNKGFPLPFGLINDNKRSLVSVTNLVDLIRICIYHPNAVNQTFLVSDDHDVSTSEMVEQMTKALGKPKFQLPVPKWVYKFFGKFFGKQDVVDRLLGSLQVDITHTKETLDWKPPQTLQEGFKETAEAFLLNKENKK